MEDKSFNKFYIWGIVIVVVACAYLLGTLSQKAPPPAPVTNRAASSTASFACASFIATPTTITFAPPTIGSSKLAWSCPGADTCTVEDDQAYSYGPFTGETGSADVYPSVTATYTLICQENSSSILYSSPLNITVTVNSPGAIPRVH